MKLTLDEIQINATRFSKRWENAHREKADEQPFIIELLGVFGVDDPVKAGERQKEVKIKGQHTRWIDYFWKNKIAIEMKSAGERLDKAYWQLRERYMDNLPAEDVPDLWLVCDFQNFHLRRMSTKEIFKFALKDLRKNIRLFPELTGHKAVSVKDFELEVNVKAAEKMANLSKALATHGYEGHPLELYLVRLLFCMFADDTGIFHKDIFYRYIKASKSDGSDLSDRIARLFEVLNMDEQTRAKRTLLSDELKQFKYINGSLFEERLPPADFNAKMRQTLLDCINFNWENIHPAIFGAMFQGVMDTKQRREIGAHYTSEENIEKLINPLFMNELWAEFHQAKNSPKALEAFHNKIANLKFLDPACGCGNFLIVTYGKLRELELEILRTYDRLKTNKEAFQIGLDVTNLANLLKVSVEQFYGIEIESFPCQIAQVGMWLIEHQMNLRLTEFGTYYERLPLTHNATIIHSNALRMEWEDVVPKGELNYILGNPPFNGARMMSATQKDDMNLVFGKLKGVGNLDYVTAWYKKAADMMESTTHVRAAFVSTNSIAQGEQPAILWKPLMERGVFINFGIPTFKWYNEAKGKAAVHCVIIGFSYHRTEPNINPYLLKAPNVFIESRRKPISDDVPDLVFGNMANDGGNLIIEADEYEAFLRSEPAAVKFIRKFTGSVEFINNLPRYCLWLAGATPQELRAMPKVMERVGKVRELRSASTREGTRKKADTPTLFAEIRQPETEYIIIPRVSSERRDYIPMGFIPPNVIASDAALIIPNATLYHFGILTSNTHMAWTRAVCGRLEMRYRYSKDIVYNNFPWPKADDKQKAEIEKLAQAILDARAAHPTSSLADLYDPLTMPPNLRKAHQNLDQAVMKLYNFPKTHTEADVVAELMEMYQDLTGGK
jgi:type I restriction-modification system DNA methylase subunit